MTTGIRYSRGKNKFDNLPNQRKVATFTDFANAVLSDRAPSKGMTYVCAQMNKGLNDDQKKYPGEKTWRAKHLAASRNFLPFDFDGFDAPETFAHVLQLLNRYQGFGYTTASHSPDAPRCRAVLAQNRPTTRNEGIALGKAVQCVIERDIGDGKIKFDKSVYQAEQPLYTPVKKAETFRFDGIPVDVDALLNDPCLKDKTASEKKPYSGGENNSFLDGSRNRTLASLAGTLRRQGATVETIDSALQALNDKCCDPPLPSKDVNRIAKSIGRYEPAMSHALPLAAGFQLVPVADLLKAPKPHDWVIRGYLERDSLNLLFGDPAAGKSLLAVDWAACVSIGREWSECVTKRGSVIYLAGEGHNGLSRRLKGWEVATGCALDAAPIFVSTQAISLIDAAGVQKIIESIEMMIEKNGIPILLVVDTLARHFAGGDENGAPDMTQFIAALDVLRQKYHCAVLIVHHTGHSHKGRARSHSALPAAVDAIFCLTSDNGFRLLRCDKAKDFEPPKERAFTVQGVSLPPPWLDDDIMIPLSAPVLMPTSARPMRDKPLPPAAQTALRALRESMEKNGIKAPKECIAEVGSETAIEDGKVVALKDWQKRYFDTCGKETKGAAKKAFQRAKGALLKEGKIKIFDIWVWLPEVMTDLSTSPE